ncbi:ubiquitin/ISG15-conjugating enzyme E2 L6 isoform X2 [Phaenicophaeus curvirostris]|uniref:ubiquitin/ISG15-conjugating enzyme E2 L6 isoform X2 n=1 Tax=Phaenicophaeus curvirostris TaxID=33595 RepID=UPI0037F0C007
MAGRLAKELEEARSWGGARELRPLGGDVRRWGGILLPLSFSPHHPLSPPCATLCTPILHPAVDPEGRVCQPLTSPEHWVPSIRAVHVLQDLLLLLDTLDPQRVLRPDLARQLQEHPQEFLRRAEQHTRQHAERRPDPPAP